MRVEVVVVPVGRILMVEREVLVAAVLVVPRALMTALMQPGMVPVVAVVHRTHRVHGANLKVVPQPVETAATVSSSSGTSILDTDWMINGKL
jgi:hypothetical protein